MFSGKRLILLGFIAVLLIAIPLTVYLAQQQQKIRSSAEALTVLSITSLTKTFAVGDNVPLRISINTGANAVTRLKMTINYDNSKLSTSAGGLQINKYKAPDETEMPIITQGPIYNEGIIEVEINTGALAINAIPTQFEIATLTFKAISPTDVSTTTVSFDRSQSYAMSASGESQAGEDVLKNVIPVSITITGEGPSSTPTITLTPTPTTQPVANTLPVCTGLSVSGVSSDSAAPIALTLTGAGNDSDGLINKATFNYGDGSVQVLTETGGLGSGTVNIQTTHTYTTGGNLTASLVLTDNNGAQSDSTSCVQTFTIVGPAATNAPTPTTYVPQPTLAQTGPGQTVLFVGGIGAVLSVIGLFLLFAL